MMTDINLFFTMCIKQAQANYFQMEPGGVSELFHLAIPNFSGAELLYI